MYLQVIKSCLAKTFVFSFVASVLTLSFTNNALSQTDCDGECRQNLADVRSATAKYHRVEVALADGYVADPVCVASPAGGMGIHYVNPTLTRDASFDIRQPEVLLYEPMKNGKLRLVAVEYFAPALVNGAPWFGMMPPAPPNQFAAAPRLFGQTFEGPMPGHNPAMPWHYELHVWIWKNNSAGMFAQFNPAVQCSQ
ncbi:MAG: hypothetical protein H0U87_06355 [Acidobacteria bacterium]|jgi:hypothetical protein|nr:hypothetical protein [Acidobacteriota bacterium]